MRKNWGVLMLILPFFLTGCWDKKDPEDRAFIITLGVDKTEEGCCFTFAPANIETGEAKSYTAEGETLAAAVAQADTRASRKLDLGQLKTVLLGESLLREGEALEAFLQELEQSRSVSEKVMLLAAEGSAADCTAAVMEEDSKTGLFLWDFYKNTAGEVAFTKAMDLDTFLMERTEQGGSGVLPRIRTEDTGLRLGGGMAVTPEGVFVLEDAAERGYLFLLGEAEGAVLESGGAAFLIKRSEAIYDFTEVGDSIVCTVTLIAEGSASGGEADAFSVVLRQEAEESIRMAESAGADWCGLLPRLERAMPAIFSEYTREELWERLVVQVEPMVRIVATGRSRGGLESEKNG